MEQIQKYVEHCRHIRQTGLNVCGQSMPNSFQITNYRYQRQGCFNIHSFIPCPLLADFHVYWNTVAVSKAVVCQNNGFVNKHFHQWIEALIIYIHGIPIPDDHTAKLVEEPAKLDPNAPTLQHPLSRPFLPTCWGLQPSRMGKSTRLGNCR